MYVRLAVGWTDSSGIRYNAGEFVDIDAGTLAELEELGVVEENDRPAATGAGTGSGEAVAPWADGEVVAQWPVHGIDEESTLAWTVGAEESTRARTGNAEVGRSVEGATEQPPTG